MSSIIVRVVLGPLLLVLVSALSLVLFDIRSGASLQHVVDQHNESARLKDVIQQAIGDMAAAQQGGSDYVMLSGAGLDAATMNNYMESYTRGIRGLHAALAELGRMAGRKDADKAEVALASYEKAAAQMFSMATGDPAMGISLMRNSSRRFGEMMDALQAWWSQIEQAAAASMGATQRRNDQQRLMSWAVVTAVYLVALLLVFLSSRSITRPLRRMEARMIALTEGDLESAVCDTDQTNEIGRMARSVDVFKANARETRRLQAEASREQASKARRQAAMDRHTQDFGTSAAGVMASLARSAEAMRATATDMSEAARQTRDSASSAANAATESATNLAAVSAATEQMSSSINEISQQVGRVTQAVSEAIGRANDTDAKVVSLASAADRVGDVVKLITEIASRTNLLALNATIEAARAGEAGKGFAVVAAEVKALATQTAKATDEITAQIAAIKGSTDDAVAAVREASHAIGVVDQVASAIAAAVEQQAAATREIAASVRTVSTATNDATTAIQQVSAISEQTDAASAKVLDGSGQVGRDADTLRGEVTQFLVAMATTSEEDRRQYERIPGNGVQAVLRTPGHSEARVPIVDVSRGGIAVCSDWWDAVGVEVQLQIPGADGTVTARAIRSNKGVLGLAFRQSEDTLRRVDQALAHIRTMPISKAA
ncbi:MAG TPA: methyl-accepting chemotaxis protein [Acetobacteraceae bacterium]|nr:methyl-accepting chemotaxis protein [Acetobacteraceae bacterium]